MWNEVRIHEKFQEKIVIKKVKLTCIVAGLGYICIFNWIRCIQNQQ
jgi:hypothetical protein